jgi:para-nitrobenzyl esterase
MHMKSFVTTAVLLLAAIAPTVAMADATAPAAAALGYSVEGTDIGTLLDDPVAKAVIDKNLPGFSSNPQINMARSMTLKSVQQYAPDMLSDQALTNIQADLNKLPKKK